MRIYLSLHGVQGEFWKFCDRMAVRPGGGANVKGSIRSDNNKKVSSTAAGQKYADDCREQLVEVTVVVGSRRFVLGCR